VREKQAQRLVPSFAIDKHRLYFADGAWGSLAILFVFLVFSSVVTNSKKRRHEVHAQLQHRPSTLHQTDLISGTADPSSIEVI
jgi:hypothetical protein